MVEHLRCCPVLAEEDVVEKETFFRIIGRGNICKRCFTLFSVSQWENHRKSQACRKKRKNQYRYQRSLPDTLNQPSINISRKYNT